MNPLYPANRRPLAVLLMLFVVLFPISLVAQQLRITDFAVFGGNGSCPLGSGQKTPPTPGCGVMIGNGSAISGGAAGSFSFIKTGSSVNIGGGVYSGGNIQFSGNNTIAGRITAANGSSLTGNILQVGTSASLAGNIDVNGNILVNSGTVLGKVTHPTGTVYSGPVPTGGNVTGVPALPTMPFMPAITTFPAAGSGSILTSKTITPGAYGTVALIGAQTLTFSFGFVARK